VARFIKLHAERDSKEKSEYHCTCVYTHMEKKTRDAAVKSRKALLLISYTHLNFHGCHADTASLIQMLISTKAIETAGVSSYTAHKGINDKMFL
jgi:hypothetical protein